MKRQLSFKKIFEYAVKKSYAFRVVAFLQMVLNYVLRFTNFLESLPMTQI